jgi:hypothetical protein
VIAFRGEIAHGEPALGSAQPRILGEPQDGVEHRVFMLRIEERRRFFVARNSRIGDRSGTTTALLAALSSKSLSGEA